MATGIVGQLDQTGTVSEVTTFGRIEIPKAEVATLSSVVLVERLVAGGISRLSAERMVAITRGVAEPSRARTHTQSRR